MTHTHTNIFFKKNKDVHIYIYIWLYIRMNSDVSYKHHVLAMNPLSCQPTFSSYLEPPVLIVGLRSRWCQVPCQLTVKLLNSWQHFQAKLHFSPPFWEGKGSIFAVSGINMVSIRSVFYHILISSMAGIDTFHGLLFCLRTWMDPLLGLRKTQKNQHLFMPGFRLLLRLLVAILTILDGQIEVIFPFKHVASH